MAIITTPGAGVSPYEPTTTAPAVLRAGADGSTTLAVVADTATGANTSVYVSGQAALNSLITSSQPGVFEGANVTINLEEQTFSTTNQVTATTNYPSGNTGEIQYNSGANSFASDAYFTYTNSNVITPGIRTNGYFYANGAPFLAGGNAAIGNFVFTGDTMTTSNPTLYITANGDSNSSVTSIKNVSNAGNADILLNRAQVAITSGTSNTWTFDALGNLSLPGLYDAQLILNPTGGPGLWTPGGTAAPSLNYGVSSNVVVADNIVLTTDSGNSAWIFSPNGNLTVPGNSIISPPASPSGQNGANLIIQGGAAEQCQVGGVLSLLGGTNYYSPPGNVVIGQEANFNYPAEQWIFGYDGNLTFPTGNLVIIPDYASESNAAVISSTDHVLALLSTGVNGGVQSVWVEDVANIGTSNTAAVRISPISQTGNIQIQTGNNSSINTWTFDALGNLTLPGNIIAINYANGNRVTGNVTFRDEIVIGTGTSNLISGLYLAPSSSAADANMYLRVRGNINDEPTHIHFDTGNNQYYNQFIGDDNKYIQLANTGNIVINSNDAAGNSAQWTFGTDGNLTTPGSSGNITGANVISANVFTAPGNVTVTANISNWTFDNSGDLTIPGNVNLPLVARLNSGGIGVPNSAEFGTEVTIILPSGSVTGSQIYMSAGTGEGRIIVNNSGNTLTYYGVENPGFAGTVAMDPGVTSEYAIRVGTNNQIEIGAVVGPITTTEYVTGMGVLNTTANITGLFANANVAVIGVGNTGWAFGADGNLVVPGDSTIKPFSGDLSLDASSGNVYIKSKGHTFNFDVPNGHARFIMPNDGEIVARSNLSITMGDWANTLTGNSWVFSEDGNLTAPGNISTTGNITGAYFFGNGSQLTDVGAATVPSQTILPTIQTITAIPMLTGYLSGGQGGVTVTVANTIPVTEYGVIVTAGTNVQTYAPGDLGSIPGTGNITFTTGLSSPASFTVYAYVTSNAGTYYSNAVIGTSGMCLLAGTQIALSDGSHKAIEHITYTDKLLSWDFDRGCYAETTAMWIKRSETGSQYNLLTFSDGTTLRTFDQHRIFNKQAGAFTYPMTDATPVGTVTVNEHGQEITLTNKQVIQDTIEYYNVITDYHMNLFSDSVLTSCRFNNIYPIVDMKFAKDGRTLRTRAEFENVEDRFFHGLRLAEQTADIETVEWYVDRLLSTEVLTQSELAF